MIHLKGSPVWNDTYSWAQSFLTVRYHQFIVNLNPPPDSILPVDYHDIECVGMVHSAEWLNGWRSQHRLTVGPFIKAYSDSLEVLNPDYDVEAERNDWVVIDRKRDKDGDGKIGEDPPGDMNGDSLPGFAGVDDDGDNLIDEDSWGRQPWEPFYTNDLMNDDDEDGFFDEDSGKIRFLDEDPGGFEGGWKWEHIMLLKEYYWVDWTQYGNEDYIKTQGHIYAFIHAHGGKPGSVEEGPGHDQFRYPIIFAWDHPYEPGEKKIWNILFRIPRRP